MHLHAQLVTVHEWVLDAVGQDSLDRQGSDSRAAYSVWTNWPLPQRTGLCAAVDVQDMLHRVDAQVSAVSTALQGHADAFKRCRDAMRRFGLAADTAPYAAAAPDLRASLACVSDAITAPCTQRPTTVVNAAPSPDPDQVASELKALMARITDLGVFTAFHV
jgi:hypothetical protein